MKLTVIFAPCARNELLDLYHPKDCPYVDSQLRILIRQLSQSGSYVDEPQDKVVYINCGSVNFFRPEEGPITTPVVDTMIPKLKRAIQLIHELLDYWHGYKGTVQTTFCSFTPLQGLMEALQNILKCPSSLPQTSNIGSAFSSAASALFSDAFDLYYEWTFVNKHSSYYEAEYKYESRDDRPETDLLNEDNERIINSLPEDAQRIFRKYQENRNGIKTLSASAKLGLEGYMKYHPELDQQLKEINKNNKRLDEISAWAEKWSHMSKAQRKGYVKKQLDKQYDPQIQAVDQKYPKYLAEIQQKREQLYYQQGNKVSWTDDYRVVSRAQRAYDAYDINVEYHGETHSRDQIEYNGEYYTMDQLDELYNRLSAKMTLEKKNLQDKKKAAWSKATDEINKQVYKETFYAGVAIVNIVAIVFAPLVIIDLLVITYELAFTDKEFDWSTALSIALDVFALVPFVGAVAKATTIGSKFAKIGAVPVADTIVNDVTKQGKFVVGSMKESEQIAKGMINNADNLGLSELSSLNNKILAEEAAADLVKGEASKMTKNFYNAAGKGEIVGQVENDLTKAANIAGQAAEITNKAEALKATRQATAVGQIDGHILEANMVIAGNVPGIGGGIGEVVQGLPVISLRGYVSDIAMFTKNAKNMSTGAKLTVLGNLGVQTVGHYGSMKGAYDNFGYSDPEYTAHDVASLTTVGNRFTVQTNGDNFVLAIKN